MCKASTMTRIDLKDAQGGLKALLDKASAGEVVFIVDGERTYRVSANAQSPEPAHRHRRPGRLRDRLDAPSDEAFAPMTEAEVAEWERGPVFPNGAV